MAKDFLEELKDELNDMMLAETQRLHEAVKNREKLPLIMTPTAVMRKIHQVAMAHEVTGDELMQTLAAMDLSPEDAVALTDAAEKLNEE